MAAIAPPQRLPSPLTSRGRRPALIPHHTDLSLSLHAASAALSSATYSPARDATEQSGVWVLPAEPHIGEAFKEDVFSWVNSPTSDDEKTLPPSLKVDTACAVAGSETVPTSPLSGSFEGLERQKRRLQEAGREC